MELTQMSFQWPPESPPPPIFSGYTPRERVDRELQKTEGKSRLSRNPIPADPGYGAEIRPFSAPCGVGSVLRLRGADAKAIYIRATASDSAPYFVNAQRSNMHHRGSKTGQPPKNYLNENVKQIRRVMRENQRRQVAKIQSQPKTVPVKALWHSKNYDHVQSAVKQKLDDDQQRLSSRPQSVQGNFLRAHGNTGPQVLRCQSVGDLRQGPMEASTDSVPIKVVENKIKPDYVKINSRYVKQLPKTRKSISTEAVEEARKKQDETLKSYKNKQNGRLPNYIEKIKEKRDEENYQALINAPDPECPPGHTKVSDEQRAATLQQLQFNRSVLEKRLAQLPIRNDSVTLRRTKQEIEKKIIELDEAIQIFSKPKVFLKIDE